jgi:hypothetical protein
MITRKSPFEAPLLQLASLLEAQDFHGLEAALLEFGLDQACGADFVDFCRIRREAPIVIMLSTLGVANGIDVRRSQRILDLYQSAMAPTPKGFLAILPANHVLRKALAVWHSGKDLPFQSAADSDSGTNEDHQLAVEFLLDHDRDRAASDLVLSRWQGQVDNRHRLILIELMLRRQGVRKPEWSALQHWNRVYEHAYSVLKGSNAPDAMGLSEQLAMVIGENILKSPEPLKVLPWCRAARSPRSRIKAWYHEAHARCLTGETDLAIKCLDEALLRLPAEPLSWIQDHFQAPGGNSNEARRFDVDSARKAIVDLNAALAPVGIKPFLVSGTLLGYARCGDFLSHDKDIDVGIFGTVDNYQVLMALAQSGKFRIVTDYMRLDRNYNLVCWHLPTGMPIDIFTYHREGEWLYTGVYTDLGYLQRFRFTPFDLQPIEFVDVPIHAPSDIDLNLRENFGDWQTPDPQYISHLESPSTEDQGGQIHMLVARLMLLKAVIKGSPEIAARVMAVLDRHAESPWALSPSLVAMLCRHFDLGDRGVAGACTQSGERGTRTLVGDLANV